MSIITFLRDPIWQWFGVLVAVITLLITMNGAQDKPNELSIVYNGSGIFKSNFIPPDRIKLTINGSEMDLGNVQVDYIDIQNTSAKAILPSDFVSQIEVSKGSVTKKILSVESCSQKAKQLCDSQNNCKLEYVSLEWALKGDKWSALPTLFNSGELACVMLISERLPLAERLPLDVKNRYEWNIRVSNFHTVNYSSQYDYKHRNLNFSDYFDVYVYLQGYGVYWFLVLQAILFIVVVMLGYRSGWISELSVSNIFRILLIQLFSLSTSEILVDIFINKDSMLAIQLCTTLIGLHVIFCMYLFYKWYLRSAEV